MIQMKTVAGVRRLWPGMDPEQREETQTEEREGAGDVLNEDKCEDN